MPVNPPDRPPEDRKEDTTSPWGFAMGAGTELVVSVLAGFFLGQWLDKKLNASPWLMLAGTFTGITIGLYHLIKAANSRLKRR